MITTQKTLLLFQLSNLNNKKSTYKGEFLFKRVLVDEERPFTLSKKRTSLDLIIADKDVNKTIPSVSLPRIFEKIMNFLDNGDNK